MNVVDLVAVLLIIGIAFVGYRSGAVVQIGGLVGAVVGLALGIALLLLVREPLAELDPTVHLVITAGVLILGFGIGQGLGAALGSRIATGKEPGALGAANRVSGVFVGALEALVVIWLLGSVLAVSSGPQGEALANGSAILRGISWIVPPSDVVARELENSLGATGIPELFSGLVPDPAAPAELPSGKKSKALATAAEPSTVKVVSSGCEQSRSGSGAVIADHYAVTNAHVIAGSNSVRLEVGGRSVEATPVSFDPDLDLALVYAPSLEAPAMPLAGVDAGRGAKGVAMGYPGGGPLVAVRASVNQRIRAIGMDMYGKKQVTRDVLELHADINPGDSGGPLVLKKGQVAGVIFAKSLTDSSIGYALTPTSVSRAVSPAIGQTSRVATGRCVSDTTRQVP
ncbi:MAG: MarP family serine protease [Candidatus Nanopelagicales bacterium]|nr:MarP family serine protease [Candidatus Nanopelagicales bacterium]